MPLETMNSAGPQRESGPRFERSETFEPTQAGTSSTAEVAGRVTQPEEAEGKRGEENGLRREREELVPASRQTPRSAEQRGRIVDLDV